LPANVKRYSIMHWLIKNPAPSDSRRTKWGDFHFGKSLAKYLERLGHEVTTQYDPGWGEELPCDVVLVLRGRYEFKPSANHQNAVRVMWNISHPADVSLDEYESFDLVFVASRPWAERLGSQIDTPVHPLLQCTDLELFNSSLVDRHAARSGIVFIGNTRSVERPGVLWALDYGLPLRIWGRGWDKWSTGEEVVADYFPNEDLGTLYSRSRATLNDHWDDMKDYGFINNRTFDALACGLPVISDWHDELYSMIPSGILYYQDRAEFEKCVDRLLLEYPRVLEEVQKASERVTQHFSFEDRVRELCDLVENALKSGTPMHGKQVEIEH
jgi:Glycosyl transferases group 1